jgi:hypothetical protein
MPEYSTISVRKALHDEIKKAVGNPRRGYDSIAEFTKEAIRLHLHRVVKPNIENIALTRLQRAIYTRLFRQVFRE